jgi:hypothetical protein
MKNGHINRIAFDTDGTHQVFAQLKNSSSNILGNHRYFFCFGKMAEGIYKIIHPAGVIIAFDQIIKILGFINVSYKLF